MSMSLQAETILKLGFLAGLLVLLGYLVTKLIVLDETIALMVANRTFG